MELAKLAAYFAFKEAGPSTNLMGVNRIELFKANLDVLFNGLNENELAVMKYLQNK